MASATLTEDALAHAAQSGILGFDGNEQLSSFDFILQLSQMPIGFVASCDYAGDGPIGRQHTAAECSDGPGTDVGELTTESSETCESSEDQADHAADDRPLIAPSGVARSRVGSRTSSMCSSWSTALQSSVSQPRCCTSS